MNDTDEMRAIDIVKAGGGILLPHGPGDEDIKVESKALIEATREIDARNRKTRAALLKMDAALTEAEMLYGRPTTPKRKRP